MNEDNKEAGRFRPPTQKIVLFYLTISHFTWSLLLLQEDVHRTLLAKVFSQENMKEDGKTQKYAFSDEGHSQPSDMCIFRTRFRSTMMGGFGVKMAIPF
jgi:hypothetical protein